MTRINYGSRDLKYLRSPPPDGSHIPQVQALVASPIKAKRMLTIPEPHRERELFWELRQIEQLDAAPMRPKFVYYGPRMRISNLRDN